MNAKFCILFLFLVKGGNLYETNSSSRDDAEYKRDSRRIFGPISSPFFYVCHPPRQGEPTSDLGFDDVRLSLVTSGTHKLDSGYQPKEVYELLIKSNVQIDGFLLTGVHAVTKKFMDSKQIMLPPSVSGQNSAGMICSILNSHISKKPKSSYSLLWMAPSTGTGCVAFLATGSLQEKLLFKDLKVLEVCEQEQAKMDSLKVLESILSSEDETGLIFKDDFNDLALKETIWEEPVDSIVKESPIVNNERVLTLNSPISFLQSKPMNFSEAQHIQYMVRRGHCKIQSKVQIMIGYINPSDVDDLKLNRKKLQYEFSGGNVDGQIKPKEDSTDDNKTFIGEGSGNLAEDEGSGNMIPSYDNLFYDEPSTEFKKCSLWKLIAEHQISDLQEVHSVPVPLQYRRKDVCIKFQNTKSPSETEGCSAIDNIAVVTEESFQGPIIDDFDPIDPSNWFFFPGAKLQESCGSDGNSLFFNGIETESWVSTRHFDFDDLESIQKDAILYAKFEENNNLQGWEVEGGDKKCAKDGGSLTFHGSDRNRICSTAVDARSVGVIRISMGLSSCSTDLHKISVQVFVVLEGENNMIEAVTIMRKQETFSLVMPSQYQQQGIKICIEQIEQNNNSMWSLTELVLLPWLPSKPQYFFQSQLNLACGYVETNVDIEATNNEGSTWWSFLSRCVPGDCEGRGDSLNPLNAHGIHSGWTIVTLPLPYMALVKGSRIRIKQLEGGNSVWRPSWALDYIYIGKCLEGCNGHGFCSKNHKCKCEYGFKGDSCEIPERSNPMYISEPFMGDLAASANILEYSGAERSYQCGMIGTGQAAVFKGRGLRFMTTVDINTTDSHYLQFHFRAGTVSDVGKCPGPDDESESIYVHYSCSGGTTWHLLKSLNPNKYREPSHISVPVPTNARDSSCRFQIWQANHSGSGRDIWAIDDLTVTSELFNTIQLSFQDSGQVNNSLRFHLGEIGNKCNRRNAMVFSERSNNNNGLHRFLETKSISVGPSYMMQFDLTIGCDGISYSEDLNSTVVLEYSLNHGLTWKLVQNPCKPSNPGCEPHFTRGTVYHVSEYNEWKRVTIRLPKRTWSPTTRLRLRQLEVSESGLPWAVDNLYIGHQCAGLCSDHGYCTSKGCSCDDDFHGHICLPLHKLRKKIDTDFDSKDVFEKFGFKTIGGVLVNESQGCGVIVSQSNLYFGVPGIRHFETDDINVEELHSISFFLVIGGNHGLQKMCLSAPDATPQGESSHKVSYGSVVLEFSTDGGISWSLLRELIPAEYRVSKHFSLVFSEKVLEKAKGDLSIIRFRIWQPDHEAADQWAIDNFAIKPFVQTTTVQADFTEGSHITMPWLTATKNSHKKYCNSDSLAQVMDSLDPQRKIVTNILALHESDVITFQINVGCSEVEKGSSVRFEFSRDGGNSWQLVSDGCLPSSADCIYPKEPTVYWPGHHGKWHRTLIKVDHRFTHGDVQFRWIQENLNEMSDGEFALKDLYIGPPCRYSCHGHGLCTANGFCKCEKGFSGKFCGRREDSTNPWLRDDFEYVLEHPSEFWENVDGALVSAGCNSDHDGKVLFFSGDEHRFLTTKELDTRNIKYLVFDLQIGADSKESRCRKGQAKRDDVMLEYSIDNTLTWEYLRRFEPSQTLNRSKPLFIVLPRNARNRQTRFRWWQIPPHMINQFPGSQAQWQLDNVMVLANNTLPFTFMESFTNGLSNDWFRINGGKTGAGCGKEENSALIFSGHEAPRFAETWDFEATDTTVVQFDIKPRCTDQKVSTTILVEYSTDNGKSWHLVKQSCPPHSTNDCLLNDLPSIYSSNAFTNWKRVTIPLSEYLARERVRLRFKESVSEGGTSDPFSTWAIDNIFIGNSCPWMCSGHGTCFKNKCKCDKGYYGPYCVPNQVLPCEVLDKFNQERINESIWTDIQGAEISNKCGAVVSKSALVFSKDGDRYATTIDLDMTGGDFLQFSLLMDCQNSNKIKNHLGTKIERTTNKLSTILIQFSTTGGIFWHDLKSIIFHTEKDRTFISVALSDFPAAKTNSTRFRIWQPEHDGLMTNVWAIDNLFIGGMATYPNFLFDDFNGSQPASDAWIDWPGAYIKPMCGIYESRSSIVFEPETGEHAIYTRDLMLNEQSVLQFDIKVGCGNETIYSHNITLEYSTDFGLSWTPLRSLNVLVKESPDFSHELQTPTTYYANSIKKWERVTIPLHYLPICSNVRFRWVQGFYNPKETSIEWALDNVYIGTSCPKNCLGHGYCINGDLCDCDDRYEQGQECLNSLQNDQQILQDFSNSSFVSDFEKWSGAELSSQCDVLSGSNLLFWQSGERMLITKDLDLTQGTVVQFYLRFNCQDAWYVKSENEEENLVILLQYSKDGGITWTLISELIKRSEPMNDLASTNFFSFNLPEKSKWNSTRLRWWQPSYDGFFKSQWAIDQIYIGSSSNRLTFFFDDGNGKEWLLRPGSEIEEACGFQQIGLHYSGNSIVRFAETPDITTDWKTYLQFEISIGCKEINHCFDINIDYSINHGKTWNEMKENCPPDEPECPDFWDSSSLTSDLFTNLTQVTIKLPTSARSSFARFRFRQSSSSDSHHSFFLGRTYVGNECPNMCFGRGFCDCGVCICHQGWKGDQCEERLTILPKFISDFFTNGKMPDVWNKVVGARPSDICGPVASGTSLHFYGSCSRLLETVDIDLRKAFFVQFDLKTGCLDRITGVSASGNNSILVQSSCDAGISWTTLKIIPLIYYQPEYFWIELPESERCLGGRMRWWQPGNREPRQNMFDWAIDDVHVGGKSNPHEAVTVESPEDFKTPLWLKSYNSKKGKYCNWKTDVQTLESTPSEPALIQTTDIKISVNHSLYFRLALGCGALWDNGIEPVRLEYSKDYGRKWNLVRDLCLPFNSSNCNDLHDESVYYAPQDWQYYVLPLDNIGPAKYMRLRWIQRQTADVMGSHKWALTDVYVGDSCKHHCYGRGSCHNQKCSCDTRYEGTYCQEIISPNKEYIKDTFEGSVFEPHWEHIQGALLSPGCYGELEEPPAITFQGPHTRAIKSIPLDTRSGRFVLFTAFIGSLHGQDLCRSPDRRLHNVFLQYSINGGITWHLLRELDYHLYTVPQEDYILLPKHAMTLATTFRFWQPRLDSVPPAWSLDNVFIGGSEIGSSQFTESFDSQPTITEWLFAPHSQQERNYCEKADNGSMVWQTDNPGQRAITTQELIVNEGHVLQFKISVGCNRFKIDCYTGPDVHLEFTKDGGSKGWELVLESCFPETSPDPDCLPYTFHGPSIFSPETHSTWKRITIPLPEKTWSTTTQLRWVQDAKQSGRQMERIIPWALDDVYIGPACNDHCRGRGDCVKGKCQCDIGYHGESCKSNSTHKGPLPTSLIDGFEGSTTSNWEVVTGGSVGLGCNSLAPYGHGKHLYFSGCGIRQAISVDLDTRRASKVMFVLRIGSHDGIRSCYVDTSNPNRIEDKGVVFQFSNDNGVHWITLDIHNPLDFRKARRVAYSLPEEARTNGLKLRWWQPFHAGAGTDQWALDNVEIVLAQRKSTSKYSARIYHDEDL